jgi:hypothetical protein
MENNAKIDKSLYFRNNNPTQNIKAPGFFTQLYTNRQERAPVHPADTNAILFGGYHGPNSLV